MDFQPKYTFDKSCRQYVALKEFTDREEPQETFKRKIEELSNDLLTGKRDIKVLVYYGVGGIGKTSLKNILKKKVFEMANTVALEVDFKNVASRECARGLLELSNSIKGNKKTKEIKFPHFELAYAIYFKKKNPDYLFSEDKKNLFGEYGIGIEILSNLDPTGLLGVFKLLIDKVYADGKKLKLDQRIKENIKEFASLPLEEMECWLPAYFAYDLNSTINRDSELKIVFFMDTFEALNENETHELRRTAKQEWIQELIKNMPNALFTILGREKIDWGIKWEKVLEQHLLSELSLSNAERFLEKCGIEECEIRKKIAQVSNGHPYYLDLSVDSYFSIKNRDITISVESLGSEKREILEVFVQNLNEIEIELLKIMSIPNYYNFEIFSILIDRFKIPYPATQFNYFNQYSFIAKNYMEDKYYIHQLMREGMDEYIDDKLKNEINKEMFEYYQAKFDLNKRENIYECIYHKLQLTESSSEFFEWIINTKLDYLKNMQVYGESFLLSNLFGQIRKKYEVPEFSVRVFNVYEDMVHLSGNYQESVNMSELYLTKYSEEEIFSNKELIKLKYRIIHHKMFYVNADDLYLELITLQEKICMKRFFDEYCEVLYMLGGGIGFLTGKLERSRKDLSTLISLIGKTPNKSIDLRNTLVRAIRKEVDYYRINGDINIARELCEKHIKKDDLSRYQIYLLCSYGEINRISGNITYAKVCFEKVLRETNALGIKGWVAHAYVSLANIELDLSNFAGAKKHVDKAKSIYDDLCHQWGIINSEILSARIEIKETNCSKPLLETLEEIKLLANKYSYRYEIGLIDDIIKSGDIGKQQLLYL